MKQLPVKAAIAIIRVYQLALSGLLGSRCRFYPSCSQYTLDAIEHYGLVKGLWMAVARVGKCHPFHPGGYDPVPCPEEDEGHRPGSFS